MNTVFKPPADITALRKNLQADALSAQDRFTKKHPNAVGFLGNSGVSVGKLREHAGKIAASSALAASLLLSGPVTHMATHVDTAKLAHMTQEKREQLFGESLRSLGLKGQEDMTPKTEKTISSLIETYWGIKATAELEGNRLNHSYGYIGAEQHLPRYPGDSIWERDSIPEAGITPGKGAWGYFAPSKSELTGELTQNEKYYVAVQTLYLPDWKARLPYLRDWYKYRKVVVVNPNNGKMVVAVVADAGPGFSTGKQFGGSPEVMRYLQLKDGKQKKQVVLYFVNDKDQEVPLGPVTYNYELGRLAEK